MTAIVTTRREPQPEDRRLTQTRCENCGGRMYLDVIRGAKPRLDVHEYTCINCGRTRYFGGEPE